MGKIPMLKTCMVAVVSIAMTVPALWAYSGEYYVVCKLNPNGDNFLALRTCGSTKCTMTHKLPPGTVLSSWEPYAENHWRQVTVLDGLRDESYSGPSGWVYDKYICEVND